MVSDRGEQAGECGRLGPFQYLLNGRIDLSAIGLSLI